VIKEAPTYRYAIVVDVLPFKRSSRPSKFIVIILIINISSSCSGNHRISGAHPGNANPCSH